MRFGEEKKGWLIFIAACLFITGSYGLTGCLAQREEEHPAVLEAAKNNNVTSSVDSADGTGEAADKCLRLYLGEISGNVAADCVKTEGDRRLLSLMYQRAEDLADIRVTKNQEDGHALYRLTLKKQTVDSRGKLVTADILLFNYYWRCQISYRGEDTVNQVHIDGLPEYQYGASGEKKRLRQKRVRGLLKSPDAALKKKIRDNIILPALEREYAWVESLYLKPSAKKLCKKYPAPVQLFAHYYAVDTSYTGKGKSRRQALKDIAGQYGTDIAKLSQMTGEHYEKAAECIAIGQLWKELGAGGGKISGIRKLDEKTIEVETTDYRKGDIGRLGQIRIYTEAKGGEAFPVGTGSYLVQEETGEQIVLAANSYYERESLNPVRIIVGRKEQTAEECVEKICAGELDMACVWERIAVERERVSLAMETGEAAWKVAAQGGVLFHSGRVNATKIQPEAVRQKDVCRLICGMQLNR